MITSSPAVDNREKANIIARLLVHPFDNQLIIGDIHAPMDKLSDIYTLIEDGKIIGGWSVFHGFDTPIIVFPPNLPQAWSVIKNMVRSLNYSEIMVSFPFKTDTENSLKPWEDWEDFTWTHQFTDLAMRLENKEIEVQNISELPSIRGIGYEEKEILSKFFNQVKKKPEYQGFYHPLQLKSDLYVVCEEDKSIIGVAGTHFETPLNIQIGNVYVDPNYRSRGIGRALTTAVTLGIIKSKRVPTLFVNNSNSLAKEMYEKLGFRKYNEYQFYSGKRIN